MVKLLMSWDIRTGHESEYFEFILQEFRPGLLKLGLRPTDAWYTTYGADPQILEGAVVEDLETANRVMVSADWRRLKGKLLTLVTNYEQKVVPANGRFQF
jgi:hypothetical protein